MPQHAAGGEHVAPRTCQRPEGAHKSGAGAHIYPDLTKSLSNLPVIAGEAKGLKALPGNDRKSGSARRRGCWDQIQLSCLVTLWTCPNVGECGVQHTSLLRAPSLPVGSGRSGTDFASSWPKPPSTWCSPVSFQGPECSVTGSGVNTRRISALNPCPSGSGPTSPMSPTGSGIFQTHRKARKPTARGVWARSSRTPQQPL